jgi:hypothetical protein
VRPVIYVIRLASGRYALRRSFDHGEHAPQCSFHWEEGAQAGRSLLVRTRRRQQSDAAYVPDFLLFRPEPEVGVQGAQGTQVRLGGIARCGVSPPATPRMVGRACRVRRDPPAEPSRGARADASAARVRPERPAHR